MISPMDLSIIVLFIAALSLIAQDQSKPAGASPAPKNLKVLTTDVNVGQVMQRFTVGLGVQCSYCHVAGDFASDENPKKEIARKDVEKREPSKVSPMPEGLVNILTKNEILDMLAYIESGGKQSAAAFSKK